jgi:hypothetical protein
VSGDFFSRLEDELHEAAERRANRRGLLPHMGWTRRTALVLIPAMVLIAVPAFAAVTGVLHSSNRRHPVNVNKLCLPHAAPQRTSTARPPASLLNLLGVLRRPQTERDKYPTALKLLPGVTEVNPAFVRVAQNRAGRKVVLVPAANVRAPLRFSRDPRCGRLIPPRPPRAPGVCVIIRVSSGAASGCFTADQFRHGDIPLMLGAGHHQDVAGVVPDGVKSVSLEWPGRRVDLQVIENTFATRLPRTGHYLPRVIWHTATGDRVMSRGSYSITPGEHRRAQRSLAGDLKATRVARVRPGVGHVTSTFTMRVRSPVRASRDAVFAVTLRGPLAGDCSRTGRRQDIVKPNSFGKRRGVISVAYFATGMGFSRHWCVGTYRGAIVLWPHGKRQGFSHRAYDSFSFRVKR